MRITVLLILIFLSSAASFEAGSAGVGSEAPQAVCGEPVYYIGTTAAEPEFRVEHAFRVANPTTIASRIVSVEPDCGCSPKGRRAYAIRFDRALPARSEVDVNIGFPTAPVTGVPDIRQFTVRFAEAGTPDLGLTVLAKRLAGLDLFPGTDILLPRGADGRALMTLYLVCEDSPDLRAEVAGPLERGLSVVVERISKSAKIHLPAAVWDSGSVLEIRIEASGRGDPVSSRVVLKTNRQQSPELRLNLSIIQPAVAR